jgi:hypothetical protein
LDLQQIWTIADWVRSYGDSSYYRANSFVPPPEPQVPRGLVVGLDPNSSTPQEKEEYLSEIADRKQFMPQVQSYAADLRRQNDVAYHAVKRVAEELERWSK